MAGTDEKREAFGTGFMGLSGVPRSWGKLARQGEKMKRKKGEIGSG